MGVMDVRISVSQSAEDSYVLAAEGELDMYTVGPLRELIGGLLEDGANLLVVDLTAVSSIESTSLSALLTAARELDTSGGRLVITADDPSVLRAIELSGLDGVLHLTPSRADGIRSLVLHRVD